MSLIHTPQDGTSTTTHPTLLSRLVPTAWNSVRLQRGHAGYGGGGGGGGGGGSDDDDADGHA